VSGYLRKEEFEVLTAVDGDAAVEAARKHVPDVIVLDLMLPGIDGVEVCRRIRAFSDAYIIMLTAKSDEVDKLIGLSVGADDYLTKPFSPRELVARVRAMLRRPRTSQPTGDVAVRRFGGLEIDPNGREVRVEGRPVELTRTEFDLLDTLSAQPNVVFSRRQLLEHVWGNDWFGDDHVIDVHMGNLRRKLGDDATDPRYLRTVRGVGYRMGLG
jgi:DNA-binding response OmpR family regulator